MVAADFPITRRIMGEELDGLQPFRTLPEIEMWHHEPHRAAVLDLERLARPAMGEQGICGGEIVQGEIGGVAVMAVQHHEGCIPARLADRQQIAGGEALPLVVVARPGGDAMNVRDKLRLPLGHELRKIPEHGMFDGAIDVEPPALARDFRREPEIEHRPVLREMLTRRQPLLVRPRHLAGEKPAFLRPALLGAGQLALGRLVVTGHSTDLVTWRVPSRVDASPIHAWCRAWSSRSTATERSSRSGNNRTSSHAR